MINWDFIENTWWLYDEFEDLIKERNKLREQWSWAPLGYDELENCVWRILHANEPHVRAYNAAGFSNDRASCYEHAHD